jgi:hypothetical protein
MLLWDSNLFSHIRRKKIGGASERDAEDNIWTYGRKKIARDWKKL